ncbi:MAG TPA: hypothetical protein VF267_04820 [Gammaproteobacteria bacterium]
MNKRIQLYALIALFFGPLLAAWIWFFYFDDVRPDAVNKGDLIEPVVSLADLKLHERDAAESVAPFAGDWFIVLLAPSSCDDACAHALYLTRQVWIRLNKDADRVQRVLLAGPDVRYRENEHRDLRVFDTDANALARFSDASRPPLAGENRIYLVDPQGNLMMSYPLDFTPEMLHDDLKRLLRYSDAG